MSDFIRGIFATAVNQASEEMSNNSCNDFPVVVTPENAAQLRDFCEEYAQDDDHFGSLMRQLDQGKIWFEDWMILDLLVEKLKDGTV